MNADHAILVLAAGLSVRMGQPKQLMNFQGESLIRRAARTAVEAGVGPVIVVIPPDVAAIRKALGGLCLSVVANPDPSRGIGSSIRCGMDALGDPADSAIDAVILAVCDQPAVSVALLCELSKRRRYSGSSAVACRYSGTIGVPALFGRQLFDALRATPDESGGKQLLQRHAQQLELIDFPQGELDIDTADDMRRLRPASAQPQATARRQS